MTECILIEDCRSLEAFKKTTISAFKKTDVMKEFTKCLYQKKLEDAVFFASELFCSGHLLDLWNVILQYASQYIHYGNPKLPIYLLDRYHTFKDIISTKYIENELDSRNDKDIRHLFTEVTYILCFSQIKHILQPVKIKPEQLQLMEVNHLMRADNTSYGSVNFIKGDPKELFIPINEFAYHISHHSHSKHDAIFWMEWILSYESNCKKKKHKIECERRTFANVANSYQTDVIWMLWEIVLDESKRLSPLHLKIVKSLLDLFSIRYSTGMKRKRRFILYNAIMLICEPFSSKTPISPNGMEEINSARIITRVYKQIKQNEQKKKDDYLFHGLKDPAKQNRDMTMKKLNIMNEINTI